MYSINGASTDNTTYWAISISHIASAGTLAGACSIQFAQSGADGTNGTDGANGGVTYAFDTGTSGDPGTGEFLVNNAALASVTAVHISDTDGDSNDVSAFLATWDDNTNATARGHILIRDQSDSGAFALYSVTGDSTDNTTYWALAVTHVASAGTLAGDCSIFFTPAGSDAAGGGDLEYIGEVTASSSATVSFADLTSDYAAYIVEFIDVLPATDNGGLDLIFSTDNGSNYDNAASDYGWHQIRADTGAVPVSSGLAASTRIQLSPSMGNQTGEGMSGFLIVISPATNSRTRVVFHINRYSNTTVLGTCLGSGSRLAAGVVDAMRFQMFSGNIASGVFKLYGLRES